jgi:septal ring factor EnvC (AmiA/AmiB activator)
VRRHAEAGPPAKQQEAGAPVAGWEQPAAKQAEQQGTGDHGAAVPAASSELEGLRARLASEQRAAAALQQQLLEERQRLAASLAESERRREELAAEREAGQATLQELAVTLFPLPQSAFAWALVCYGAYLLARLAFIVWTA